MRRRGEAHEALRGERVELAAELAQHAVEGGEEREERVRAARGVPARAQLVGEEREERVLDAARQATRAARRSAT